jgi:hypothetical protein
MTSSITMKFPMGLTAPNHEPEISAPTWLKVKTHGNVALSRLNPPPEPRPDSGDTDQTVTPAGQENTSAHRLEFGLRICSAPPVVNWWSEDFISK